MFLFPLLPLEHVDQCIGVSNSFVSFFHILQSFLPVVFVYKRGKLVPFYLAGGEHSHERIITRWMMSYKHHVQIISLTEANG